MPPVSISGRDDLIEQVAHDVFSSARDLLTSWPADTVPRSAQQRRDEAADVAVRFWALPTPPRADA
ncbi:MAG: hypothetical protein HOZ81_19715 [Streptomyces sp.]|nr:hypothetical protein [Streptomyces sp.]